MEFPPLVAGKKSPVTLYFTRLEGFVPIDSGNVEIVVEGLGDSLSIDRFSSSGLMRPKLTPSAAGIYTLSVILREGSLITRFRVDSIRVFADAEAAHQWQESQAEESEALNFPVEKAWKADFGVTQVNAGPFFELFSAPGQLETAPGDESVVTASADGVFRLANSQLLPGTAVAAGQLIGQVASTGLAAENPQTRYQAAKSRLETARAEYDRAQRLIAERLITQHDFAEAKLAFDLAESEFANLSRSYSNGGQTVLAPRGGFLLKLWVSDGQYVSAGTPIATITQTRRLLLRADVPQRHYAQLALISGATLRPQHSTAALDISTLNGRLASIGRNVEQGSAFTPVFFELDNSPDFVPGEFVEVWLHGRRIPDALVVPNSALLEEQGNYYVFVQLSGEAYEKRQVTLGPTDGLRTQILSGLNGREWVVSEGAITVKLATQVVADPGHGHSH